jgi:hypothetical protein
MTEDDLRALVRDAVSRHLGIGGATGGASTPAGSSGVPAPGVHPSFGRYLLPREPGDGSQCLIEPSVKCNHCGYCESHGF